jgi:hypothetical protein
MLHALDEPGSLKPRQPPMNNPLASRDAVEVGKGADLVVCDSASIPDRQQQGDIFRVRKRDMSPAVSHEYVSLSNVCKVKLSPSSEIDQAPRSVLIQSVSPSRSIASKEDPLRLTEIGCAPSDIQWREVKEIWP